MHEPEELDCEPAGRATTSARPNVAYVLPQAEQPSTEPHSFQATLKEAVPPTSPEPLMAVEGAFSLACCSFQIISCHIAPCGLSASVSQEKGGLTPISKDQHCRRDDIWAVCHTQS